MTSRTSLISKWREDRLAAVKARKAHHGQARAGRAFIATTTALLRDEINRARIAPAKAGKAARAAQHPTLFGE